jgi:hypothetical protein
MLRLALITAVAFVAFGGAAMAEKKSWLVTEENDGIKGAQGTWNVTLDGDKLSGDANMTYSNGTPLTYKIEGSVKDGVYTVNLLDRSDGKKGCVWTGHVPTGASTQTHGLVGYAPCEGGKMVVRASY